MNTLDDLNNAMRRRTIDALRQVIGLSEKALMSLLVDVVEENPTELIAQKIQKRRMELKMTQQELADKVGVLRETVVNWETGKHRVTISLRQDLAKALLMEYGDLFWRQLPNEEDRRKLTSGMTLGERVLFLREFQWISRKEVAMFAAVDVHTVFAYDNTKRTTANKDSSILQIAIVLRVSVEELLCE